MSEHPEGMINVRGLFLRLGQLELNVREDGSMLILHRDGQRLELDRAYADILAGMMKMVSRD